MPVTDDFEIDPFGDLFLKTFDAAVFELVDGPTFDTDHVVMVIARFFEQRFTFAEMTLMSQADFFEQHQSSINGDITDRRLDFADFLEQLFDFEMFVGLEKFLNDDFPLPGVFHPVLVQVLIENFNGVGFHASKRK